MADILARSEWTAANRGGGSLAAEKVTGITLHYPASGNTKLNELSKGQVASRLRGWRSYHVSTLGWADIGYNFAVDGSGRTWELRGAGRQGVHAGNVNPIRIGILLIVGDNEEPTKEAIDAVNELWAWLQKNHFANIGRSVLGHGQEAGNSTQCPGPKVRALISNGAFSVSGGSGSSGGSSGGTSTSSGSGGGSGSSGSSKSTAQLAREVIDGKHGSGEARKRALGSRYNAVQAEVNRILGAGSSGGSGSRKSNETVAREILNGTGGWGNEPQRSQRLRAAGYNASTVQGIVNRLAVPGGSGKSVATLAREVIDGRHGSGAARKRALGSRYAAVQAEVNRILGGGSSGGSGSRKSTAQLAQEVIDGKHGSGEARRRSLGSRYAAVQAEVNRRLR